MESNVTLWEFTSAVCLSPYVNKRFAARIAIGSKSREKITFEVLVFLENWKKKIFFTLKSYIFSVQNVE